MKLILPRDGNSAQAYWQRLWGEKYQSVKETLHVSVSDAHDMTKGCERFEHLQKGI